MGGLFAIIAIYVVIVAILGIRIINQYERGVVQRLGKFRKTLGPGLHIIIPYIDKISKVDVRTTPMDVPSRK